jgi:hypothetical protein
MYVLSRAKLYSPTINFIFMSRTDLTWTSWKVSFTPCFDKQATADRNISMWWSLRVLRYGVVKSTLWFYSTRKQWNETVVDQVNGQLQWRHNNIPQDCQYKTAQFEIGFLGTADVYRSDGGIPYSGARMLLYNSQRRGTPRTVPIRR